MVHLEAYHRSNLRKNYSPDYQNNKSKDCYFDTILYVYLKVRPVVNAKRGGR